MNAEEILEKARTSTTPPQGWTVLPLSRSKLVLGILGWIFGIILGFGLFTITVFETYPSNFQHGAGIMIFTLILLAVFIFVGAGSVWMLVQDVFRLLNAQKHLIVFTSKDFVKQEGHKVINVPLSNIKYVTARGTPPPDRTAPRGSMIEQMPSAGDRFRSFFLGQAATNEGAKTHRRRRRTPSTLAFVDTRTDDEVIVVNDGVYGDPFMIAALLKQHIASAA